jgi:stage V sporulation protein AD
MNQQIHQGSITLKSPVYIRSSASIVGKKEGEGPFSSLFDMVGDDDLFGCNTWEEAESNLQKDALYMALGKAELKPEEIDLLYAGDLLGQSIASSFGVSIYHIPHIGLYGACSTCGEALALGAMSVSAGFARNVACVTSSHFASAEKEFRYPLEYGSQRPLSATWTVTGSGAFILSDAKQKARAQINALTFGKIVDFGIKDSLNMGVCMAPAAADTIERHLKYYQESPEAYDKIITGDLGKVGQQALIDLLRERDIDISSVHMDCGIEIFDEATQDTHAGGSGCGCSAVTLSAHILRQLESGAWHRVLFLPTGALLSKTSFNEGQTVPGIAHGVVLTSAKGK